MDDILLEPMLPGLTLNSASKESLVSLTLTDALTIDKGTILAEDLISTDPNNDLKLGSDNKLYIHTQTTLTQSDW
mgnify:CR=1 FL=1